jgi:AcrR family transcriptional regulator
MGTATTKGAKVARVNGGKAGSSRRIRRRDQILRTAAQLFVKRGFEATTMDDIARACKMTKPGLYYYFAGKQELLAAIMHHALDVLDEVRQETISLCPTHEERLRRFAHEHALAVTRADDAAFNNLFLEQANALTAKDRREITERQRVHFDFLRETLDGLKAEGRLHELNTTVATFTLIGMVPWISKWYRPGSSLTPELVADEMTDLVLRSVLKNE